MNIYFKKVKPPTIPKLKSPHDTSYFDSNIKEEDIPSYKENLYEKEFRDFWTFKRNHQYVSRKQYGLNAFLHVIMDSFKDLKED